MSSNLNGAGSHNNNDTVKAIKLQSGGYAHTYTHTLNHTYTHTRTHRQRSASVKFTRLFAIISIVFIAARCRTHTHTRTHTLQRLLTGKHLICPHPCTSPSCGHGTTRLRPNSVAIFVLLMCAPKLSASLVFLATHNFARVRVEGRGRGQ